MAEYLASIFGTEKDKVNCSFYFKIGACRHGDKCSRLHNMPTFSQTVLLQNLYQNPKLDLSKAQKLLISGGVSDAEEQQHFDDFFEEIFVELEDKYGEIEEMNVCDNIGEHMIGNVYVKFKREEDAERCMKGCNDRWFNGMPIYAELSPVTDFREACCRQYEMGMEERCSPSSSQNSYDDLSNARKSIKSDIPAAYSNYIESSSSEEHCSNSRLLKFKTGPSSSSLPSFCGVLINDGIRRSHDRSRISRPPDGTPSDCGKGGFCNFMHLKPISRELRKRLYGRRRSSPSRASGSYGTSDYRRSRSRSRDRDSRRRRF